MLGLTGLYFEFSHPGAIFPGVVGGICLVLAFFALQTLPVNYAGIMLIVLAIIFFIMEMKIASYGLLSVAGIISLLLGSLMLFEGESPESRLAWGVLAPTLILISGFFTAVAFLVFRSQVAKPVTGSAGLVGEIGVVKKALAPRGKVFVHGELWNAVAPRTIDESVPVRVVKVTGLLLEVEPADGPARHTQAVHIANRPEKEIPMYVGLAVVLLILFFLSASLKVLNEYERGVIFRLGRIIAAKGPGLIILIPIIDRILKVSLRLVALDVDPQDVITRDNVSVKVNAVLYFRVVDPVKAIVQVENYAYAMSQLAQTTLRSVCGQAELDDLLAERDKINAKIQEILDTHTDPWGIKVTTVELKQIDLPQEMQRAIARQAEAERERRAKVINAEGEFQAAAKLAEASGIIENHPVALQLRYLQTMREMAAENNSTTFFPIPLDLFKPFFQKPSEKEKA